MLAGLYTGLSANYYSTGKAVIMECSLGVGSDGSKPTSTNWLANFRAQ
jgi:hypothetical protein